MVEATEEIAQASVETLAEGVTEAADTLSISFWDLFMSGGWLMWVLVLLAAVMIFIFIERFIAIRRATKLDNNFMNRIRDFISEGNINAAIDLCRRTDSPVARMIEKGIERIGRPMGDIQTAIENVANVEIAKLETGLPWLASISGGAPMLGFLGTVVGMVQVFISMSASTSGAIELGQLSSGMYVAMVTTVGGLIVGIPAYFGHNYLVARIERLVFRMEATTIAFMDILNQPVQK
ncbi:MAG: MotA/TolQ/ExbB proton channel family protein [Alistipes sp.]|nr:MotA/TolQ/ExbB proton channel family protein [Alistipes sp.]